MPSVSSRTIERTPGIASLSAFRRSDSADIAPKFGAATKSSRTLASARFMPSSCWPMFSSTTRLCTCKRSRSAVSSDWWVLTSAVAISMPTTTSDTTSVIHSTMKWCASEERTGPTIGGSAASATPKKSDESAGGLSESMVMTNRWSGAARAGTRSGGGRDAGHGGFFGQDAPK